MSKDISNEVDAELKKPENKGVIASVNTENGQVQAFIEPVPYWQTTNDAGDTGSLTASEVTALEKERSELTDSLPRLRKSERAKVEHRIRVIERALKAARALEEDARRAAERAAERPAQRYGSPGNTTQHEEADPFKRAVENMQKAAPSEFRTAVEATRAQGGSVARAIRNTLLK